MGPPGGNKAPPPNYPPQTQVQQEQSPSVRPRPQQQQPNVQRQQINFIPQPQTVPPSYEYRPQPRGYRQPPEQPPPPYDEGILFEDRDEQDGHHSHQVNVNVQYQDQVSESTPNIFTSFVVNRMDTDGYDVPHELRRRHTGQNEREVARVLQRIGDDITNNTQLNDLISSMVVTPQTAYKTFFSVACEIFKDGNINWGRICTLFYFAYKLAVQVMNQIPLVDIIIKWVTKFVAQKLASWIWNRGGWSAAYEYFGATSSQMLLVFFAGVAVSSLFWYWKK